MPPYPPAADRPPSGRRRPRRLLLSLLSVFLLAGCAAFENQGRGPIPVTGADPFASAEAALANRPFNPTDTSLFLPEIESEGLPIYPGSGDLYNSTGPGPSEEEALSLLDSYLREEFTNAAERQVEGLRLYHDPALRAKVPSTTLRAGLVGLLNTVAEPGIDALLHAQTPQGNPLIAVVGFYPLPGIARSVLPHDGTDDPDDVVLAINEQYRAEDPFALTSELAGLLLMQDLVSDSYEDGLIFITMTNVYLHQLALHPWLADGGTRLVRTHNTTALMRLNSGSGSQLGLFESNGPILPGSQLDLNYIGEIWELLPSDPTPGSDTLAAYLQAMQSPGDPACPSDAFNFDLLVCISGYQAGLTPDDLIMAAHALRLDMAPGSERHEYQPPPPGLMAFAQD